MNNSSNHRAAEVGDLVRQLREAQGLQKKQLAEMSSISPSTLVRLERGDWLPQTETLIQIANALNVSYGDLAELVGFDAAKALPEPASYFRTKYGMTNKEAEQLEKQFDELLVEHGYDPNQSGPAAGEDE